MAKMLFSSLMTPLLLGFFLLVVLAAPHLDEELGPNEGSKLKIRLDYAFATKDGIGPPRTPAHSWMVSTHLTFSRPVSEISDG
jgi:hypothetical protein